MYKEIKKLLNEAIELNNKMWDLNKEGKEKEALELSKLIDEKVLEAINLKNEVFSNTDMIKQYMFEKQQEELINPENKYIKMSNGKYIVELKE